MIKEVKEKMNSTDYDFFRYNEHLGDNVILLGLSGSYAYGTNVEDSDVDIRGCALNTKREILLGNDFRSVSYKNDVKDFVVYSFPRFIELLCKCSFNVIELLGLKKEHYLYVSDVGQRIIDNKKLFLSQKAISSFGGFTKSETGKLKNNKVKTENKSKEMALLIRVYLMGLDLIEKGEILTYREKEREMLLDIRKGKYLKYDGDIQDSFYKLVGEYEERFNYAKENTLLPKEPDLKKIEDFIISVNNEIVMKKYDNDNFICNYNHGKETKCVGYSNGYCISFENCQYKLNT